MRKGRSDPVITSGGLPALRRRCIGRRFRRGPREGWPRGGIGRNAMASGKPFPLNAWYPAAWSHEIERAVRRANDLRPDIVLYRRADGAVAALEDACWHRLLPLSHGPPRRRPGRVRLSWPRVQFRRALHASCPRRRRSILRPACAAYPVVERHRLIWIWPGDPALADPARTARFPLERRNGMERRGRDVRQPEMRLPARHRQSDGSHPRDLRPRRQHRRRRDPRYAVRGHAYRPHRDR